MALRHLSYSSALLFAMLILLLDIKAANTLLWPKVQYANSGESQEGMIVKLPKAFKPWEFKDLFKTHKDTDIEDQITKVLKKDKILENFFDKKDKIEDKKLLKHEEKQEFDDKYEHDYKKMKTIEDKKHYEPKHFEDIKDKSHYEKHYEPKHFEDIKHKSHYEPKHFETIKAKTQYEGSCIECIECTHYVPRHSIYPCCEDILIIK